MVEGPPTLPTVTGEGDLAYAVVFNLGVLQRPWKHMWNIVCTLVLQDTFRFLCPPSSFAKSLQQLLFLFLECVWCQTWGPSFCSFLSVCFHSCSSNPFCSQWLVNFRENLDLDVSIGGGVAKPKPLNQKTNPFEGLPFALWTQIQSSNPKFTLVSPSLP